MYALKRELKLNKLETRNLCSHAGFKRFVWNYAIDLLIASWDFEDVKASDTKRLGAIKKLLTNVTMKRPEYDWMSTHPSSIYQSVFIDLGKALDRWRKGISGFPKKKSKKRGDSFTVYKSSGTYLAPKTPMISFTNRVVINPGKKIKLPGFKQHLRLKERIDFMCSSQTFTVSRTADRWFVAFNLDAEKISPTIHETDIIGVDLGVKALATCSDGSKYDMPVTTKTAKTKLGKLQWRNRNKVLGNGRLKIKASNNARKYYRKLASQHSHVANIRRDTTQKMTTDLSRKAYTIRIEDLNVSGMIANHKLAAAVSNQCFYEIRRQLIYKQDHYGTKVELVDRWYPSSKKCSKCDHVQPMKLSERVFNCESCNHLQDRDENAAINLKNAPSDKVRLA